GTEQLHRPGAAQRARPARAEGGVPAGAQAAVVPGAGASAVSWIVHLFRPKAELPVRAAAAVDAWRALPAVPETAGLVDTRFVVVDVETSGLNPRRDRLLSIGAVAVERMKLAPQHTFSA